MSACAGERARGRSDARLPRDSSALAERLVPLVLLAVVLALYAQTAGHAFLSYDDGSYLTENPHVRTGLGAANARWAFAEFHSANWHPLTWLSHQLDVQLFGLDAGKHHMVSAVLHALNACLCFWFLRRATGAPWASALTALLFAIHPLRVESVAWASERKDVLSGTFFFLTLLAYERHARRPALRRYGLVVLAIALGLLAKPMLVTLPVVLLLLDAWPLGKRHRQTSAGTPLPSLAPTHPGEAPARTSGSRDGYLVWLEKVPLLALAAASALLTWAAQHEGGAVRSIEVLSLDERLATALTATMIYVVQSLWPAGLAFFYPHPAFVSPGSFSSTAPVVLLSASALAAVSLVAVLLRRRNPALFTGWAWMLVMLLPVIGLVQVGAQFHADRYAYLPMLGLTLAVVFGLRDAVPSPAGRRALFGLGLLAAGALSLVAFRQIGTWRDMRTLCERALAVTDRNYVAHDHLGFLAQRAGDLARAREHYEAALAIAPRLHDVHSNLGAVHMLLGERERALTAFQEALRLVPTFLDARMLWGLLLEGEGDLAGALEHYERGAREHPESAEAWTRIGDTTLGLGRLERALEAYELALARAPDSIEALAGLGLALAERGEARRALDPLATALRLDPASARALHGTAWVLATAADPELRDPARALDVLARCAERDGSSNWMHLRTLAAALAARGRFPEAVRAAAEASALAPRSEWERLASERRVYEEGRALVR